jgi:excisionase family DNA binding protein
MRTLDPYQSFLTLEQTAARLQVSPQTVRRLIARDQLPAYRVGGQIRVEETELMVALRRQPPLEAA